MARDLDLVVFDTTCFWRSSARIERAVQQALRMGIPIVLVRSHGKLDTLGIEYGRLGSVVVLTPMADSRAMPRRLRALIPKMQDAVRLLGAAPILAHFPPFESSDDYQPCSALRTASIMRNTRRLAQVLRSRLPSRTPTIFQHGLYVTIAVDGSASVDEVKQAAGEMAAQLAADGLPVEHAGSFGFDFVAIDWSPDPMNRINSMRIAGADLPLDLTDEIGCRIAAWWLRHIGRKAVDQQVLPKRKAAA
jgi:hypothetical protein